MSPNGSHFDRITARLDSRALRANYQVIQDLVPGQSVLPMIKADGYGHGATWAARELLGISGLYGFGLATLEEAAGLRKELGPRGKNARLIVFSGAAPWSEEKGRFCERFGLTPVIATDADWRSFLKGGWPEKISYELKFNTGLNRLGMSLNLAPEVARALRERKAISHPNGVFSHLAMSESPEAKISLTQREKFEWLKRELAAALPSTHFHLGNSGAIWNQKNWGLRDLTDVVRPGLALYGIPPWKGAPAKGLLPVMTLEALVIHTRKLKAGESMGYGATFKVKGEKPVNTAILAAGYADGVNRALSGAGAAWLGGTRVSFLGRVSMDLCVVGCPESVRVGDRAELIGPHLDLWEQSEIAGTIPYEFLTSISSRVQRIYG